MLIKVLFMSFGSEPPLENPDALKRHHEQLMAAGIKNSYVYISPGTSHEWQTWRRSLYAFAPLLFWSRLPRSHLLSGTGPQHPSEGPVQCQSKGADGLCGTEYA